MIFSCVCKKTVDKFVFLRYHSFINRIYTVKTLRENKPFCFMSQRFARRLRGRTEQEGINRSRVRNDKARLFKRRHKFRRVAALQAE